MAGVAQADPSSAMDDRIDGACRMRLRVIGCEVLARPLYAAAARSRHVVDIEFLRRGLHDSPLTLRSRLQAAIGAAATAEAGYDATVLGYGLCGGATAGITAVGIPLVIPRAHDCITLFLGSRRRYEDEFSAAPGTYWYTPDYLERTDDAAAGLGGIGAGTDDELRAKYAEYARRFGPDNAEYLMETVGAWHAHYERAVFIDDGFGDPDHIEARGRADAERRGWRFERSTGSTVLFERLLAGDWADDFLVLQPGDRLAMRHDGAIVGPAER